MMGLGLRGAVGRGTRWAIGLLAVWAIGPAGVRATVVEMKDGRLIGGRLATISTIGQIMTAQQPDGGGPLQLVVMMDDDLRRIFLPKYQVRQVKQDDLASNRERFLLQQRTMKAGRQVKVVGPVIAIQPFDEHGRRIFKMNTVQGPVDVIQGITEITPEWSKVEGISHMWDMRIATSSIPPAELHKILWRQIDPKNVEHRKRIARFYLESERYEDAIAQLRSILQEFPNAGVQDTLRAVQQVAARRLVQELKIRQEAGQTAFVARWLGRFPADGVAGEILQAVREMLDAEAAVQARIKQVVTKLDELIGKLPDSSMRAQVTPLRNEIAAELGPATLPRMGPFIQALDDPEMTVPDKLALAFSGWLFGTDAASLKLPATVSAFRLRGLIKQYCNEPVRLARANHLAAMGSEETSTAPNAALLVANMKPPLDTPPGDPLRPGYYELETPGLPQDTPFRYCVQLPPEYDPYRRYPTIVTLHGSGTTAQQQVDWWAGGWVQPPPPAASTAQPQAGAQAPAQAAPAVKPPAYRSGQATRWGYIVIAPLWTVEHQREYHYSEREQAAVLHAFRDACRRFSVDTDRVFLSGHSIGGDAAWDVGLAHPDLWAGVIPIVARCDRYCPLYWSNGRNLPFYFVNGELDGAKILKNVPEFDRYIKYNFNVTVVEYMGRGHEEFSDEIQRLFDWMGRFHRTFSPREFSYVTMRPWDNRFWWVELQGLPARTMVDPSDWPPPRTAQPLKIEAGFTPAANVLRVTAGSAQVSVGLAPPMVDFQKRLTVTVNGRRMNTLAKSSQPNLEVLLEDVRDRADRQHPFWAKAEMNTGRGTE